RADEAGEQVGAPDAERMPGGDGTAGVEQGPELADEVAEVESLIGGPARSAGGAGALLRIELDGSRPLRGAVVLEALIPVSAAAHAGRPGDALPLGDGHCRAAARADAHLGEGAEQVGAGDPVGREAQQSQEEPRDAALRDRLGTRTVDGDTRGGEVLVEQSGVRVVGTVENGDAVGRGALAQGTHDLADSTAALVVGVAAGER